MQVCVCVPGLKSRGGGRERYKTLCTETAEIRDVRCALVHFVIDLIGGFAEIYMTHDGKRADVANYASLVVGSVIEIGGKILSRRLLSIGGNDKIFLDVKYNHQRLLTLL